MWKALSSHSSLASICILAILLVGAYVCYKISTLPLKESAGHHAKRETLVKPSPSSLRASERASQSVVFKESEYPDNWWNGKDVFDLERRAIFSKTWLYVSHRCRFTKPGDYHSLDIAGFPIFLILGKDSIVRAFHNVCRHRAYTITKKESGSSTVLGCRYHGWSYNTRGDLIKAPHFEDVPGFDKSQNGLFEIHVCTSKHGLIFINLDASPSVPEVDLSLSDNFATHHNLAIDSTWVAGWTLEGAFNWKMAVTSARFDLEGLKNYIPPSRLFCLPRLFSKKSVMRGPIVLGLFPAASLYAVQGSGLLYSLCFFPCSEGKTTIRCDLYACNGQINAISAVSKELPRLLRERVTKIEEEYLSGLQGLSAISDSNVAAAADEAVKESQYAILLHLKTHLKLEKTLGHEIFPTLRRSTTSAKFLQADLLCKELDCQSKKSFELNASTSLKSKEILAW